METEEEVGGVAGKKRQKGKAKSAVVKKPKLTTPTTTPTKRRKAESVKEVCKYGVKCYQTNKEHHEKFSHPWVREKRENNILLTFCFDIHFWFDIIQETALGQSCTGTKIDKVQSYEY